MSDNMLETIRATVQDLIAPELKTHGVRLDHIERRLDDMKHSLEQRIDDSKKSLEQRIDDLKRGSDDLKGGLEQRIQDSKETLRAEMQALEARMDARFLGIENLLRNLIQQATVDSNLRERVALLEARMPKQ